MKIIYFQKANGKVPVIDFINSLEKKDEAKIKSCLADIEEDGFDTSKVSFRQIKGKLWEIKIRIKNGGCRIFYVMLKNNTMILLHAYKKKSQKAPKKELDLALKRMFEVLSEMD